jgi:succinate dehydrogenase / fumarate reductase flavoprotein subunit
MGGIPTDMRGRVLRNERGDVYDGLYAAGECACVSVHGANRLGTNSLVDLVVYGRRAGMDISCFVKEADFGVISASSDDTTRKKINSLLTDKKSKSRGAITSRMQDVMMEKVGVFRTGKEMKKAVETIRKLKNEFQEVGIEDTGKSFNTELVEVLELENLLDIAYLTVVAAENRTETRGAHSRMDFPARDDDNWLKHSLIWLDGEKFRIKYREVDVSLYKPKLRTY